MLKGKKKGEHKYNHGIIGWKRPLKSSSPTVNPTPPCLLNHVPKCHIYTVFEHLRGWGFHHLPGQPVAMSDHSFSIEIFPNIQSEPPLMQLEAFASYPIASWLVEETNTCLTTTSFQAVVEHNKVPPQPLILETKHKIKHSSLNTRDASWPINANYRTIFRLVSSGNEA